MSSCHVGMLSPKSTTDSFVSGLSSAARIALFDITDDIRLHFTSLLYGHLKVSHSSSIAHLPLIGSLDTSQALSFDIHTSHTRTSWSTIRVESELSLVVMRTKQRSQEDAQACEARQIS